MQYIYGMHLHALSIPKTTPLVVCTDTVPVVFNGGGTAFWGSGWHLRGGGGVGGGWVFECDMTQTITNNTTAFVIFSNRCFYLNIEYRSTYLWEKKYRRVGGVSVRLSRWKGNAPKKKLRTIALNAIQSIGYSEAFLGTARGSRYAWGLFLLPFSTKFCVRREIWIL